MRDGIRLIEDLRGGRVERLLEAFPWVRDAITPTPSTDLDDLKREIVRLRELVERQQRAPMFPAPPRDGPVLAPLAGLRPLSPVEDDDDVALVVTASASTGSAANFLSSLKLCKTRRMR